MSNIQLKISPTIYQITISKYIFLKRKEKKKITEKFNESCISQSFPKSWSNLKMFWKQKIKSYLLYFHVPYTSYLPHWRCSEGKAERSWFSWEYKRSLWKNTWNREIFRISGKRNIKGNFHWNSFLLFLRRKTKINNWRH